RPGRYGFVAVHSSRHDGTEWRLAVLHHPHLYGRGMGTQRDIIAVLLLDEKRILHITGRELGWKIKGSEIVPVIFDFGSFGYYKAKFLEYLYDFLAHQRKGMPRSDHETLTGEGKVSNIAFIDSRIGGKLFLYGFVFLFGGLLQL